MDRDANVVRESGERFVDRVVDDLVHEVMQSALGCRSDVHAGAFANRLETLENLDLPSVVFPGLVHVLCRHWSPEKTVRRKAENRLGSIL